MYYMTHIIFLYIYYVYCNTPSVEGKTLVCISLGGKGLQPMLKVPDCQEILLLRNTKSNHVGLPMKAMP